jgi:putative PIN family toxin of toxin-antitoxin system
MIVVLDSNVWISGLEFGGRPGAAIERALVWDQLAISDFIRDEIVRILTEKFGRNRHELQQTLDELLAQAIEVEITGAIRGVSRDPKDDAILETAWRANAEVLVAGDKDLLTLAEFRGIKVLTPSEYLARGNTAAV